MTRLIEERRITAAKSEGADFEESDEEAKINHGILSSGTNLKAMIPRRPSYQDDQPTC